MMKWSVAKAVSLLLFIIPLFGCASRMSLEDLSRVWIARPLSELKEDMEKPDSYASKIGWMESTYRLANGNSVFIEPVGAECLVHWEVNPSGVIVGYEGKGTGCRRGEGPDNSIRKTQTREGW